MNKKIGPLTICSLIFLLLACGAQVSLITSDTLDQNQISDEDLKKITFYTDGQVIFSRLLDSFNSSQKAASNATIKRTAPTNMINERVSFESNTAGFYHHRTNTHIYVQFFVGELVLPFKLENGMLDVSDLLYDGKQYKYEEGEARLIGNLIRFHKEK